MTLPNLSVYSPGVGVYPADWANTVVQAGNCLVANLRAFTGIGGMVVMTIGQSAPGDGNGQVYYWNATSTATDNDLTVIVPNGVTQGAWLSLGGLLGSGAQSGAVTTVLNIAALRALSTGATPVYVAGYTTAGDGGGGLFNIGTVGPADNASTVIVSSNGTYFRDSLGEPVSIMAFGATGNGTASDSSAFTAIAAGMPNGGTILLPPGKNFYVGTSVTIPAGITLQGPYGNIGEVAPSHTSGIPWTTYVTMTIASGATITMNSSACLTGCLVYRNGMTFPTTDSSLFAGTAFHVAGDNVMFRNSLIMGFSLAITSSGFDRLTIEDMCFDNQSNISITNSNDTAKIHTCHAWPFSADSSTQVGLTRTGTNLAIISSTDAVMVSQFLAFGYETGFLLQDAGGAVLVDCDADASAIGTNIGFAISGTAAGSVSLTSCLAYSQNTGVSFSNTGGSVLKISGLTVGGCGSAIAAAPGAIGTILLNMSDISSCSFGVLVESPTVSMDINHNRIEGIANPPINSTVSTSNLNIGNFNRFADLGSGAGLSCSSSTIFVYTVSPSGSVLNLPVVSNMFSVTGGQNFGKSYGILGRADRDARIPGHNQRFQFHRNNDGDGIKWWWYIRCHSKQYTDTPAYGWSVVRNR